MMPLMNCLQQPRRFRRDRIANANDAAGDQRRPAAAALCQNAGALIRTLMPCIGYGEATTEEEEISSSL
jgi:hypothetical protein